MSDYDERIIELADKLRILGYYVTMGTEIKQYECGRPTFQYIDIFDQRVEKKIYLSNNWFYVLDRLQDFVYDLNEFERPASMPDVIVSYIQAVTEVNE